MNDIKGIEAQPDESTGELDDGDGEGVRRVRGSGMPPAIPTLAEALLAVPRRGKWRDTDA